MKKRQYQVYMSKSAEKGLEKVPQYIAIKLQAWVLDVEERGLEEVRKISGYHDEPLKGKRTGERSIRLSRAFRAIYVVDEKKWISIVKITIQEVNKHEY